MLFDVATYVVWLILTQQRSTGPNFFYKNSLLGYKLKYMCLAYKNGAFNRRRLTLRPLIHHLEIHGEFSINVASHWVMY